jgi:hypothetical protein
MRLRAVAALTLLALVRLPLAGCGPSDEAPTASGFLGDDSQLRPGRVDQAELLYIDPEADFSAYENVILDPVVVWRAEGAGFSGVSPGELESLALDLGSSMRDELGREFQMVDRPATGTLRLRIGIVELWRTSASDGPDSVERLSIEVEVLDAVSGRRLIAARDSRGGGGEARRSIGERIDVRAAFHEWASLARDRLATFRDFDSAR